MLSALILLAASAELPVLVSSAEVQIGEPIVCSVELVLMEGAPFTLADEVMEPGRAWIVLEQPKIRQVPGGARTLTWRVLALEPEPGPLPTPTLVGAGAALGLVAPAITVAPALLEGEDAPRPARGFHLPPVRAELVSTRKWWIVALLGAALLGALWWRRARRRRPELIAEPSLNERLESLGAGVAGEGPLLIAWHGELTRILRAAHSEDHAGWSDEEWIERAALDDEQREELRELLAVCAAVKYAGSRPTRFAVEETLERARALVSRAAEVAA